jgi:ADP-ribosylglycohydrolase
MGGPGAPEQKSSPPPAVVGFPAPGRYDPSPFLSSYVTFMTTPGSHNDTYAETYHRMFFKNMRNGKPPAKCADDDGHNVASMGGMVLLGPVALLSASLHGARVDPASLAGVGSATVSQMLATHNSPRELAKFAELYAQLLLKVVAGGELRPAVAEAAKACGFDVAALAAASSRRGGGGVGDASQPHPDTRVIGGHFSSACYIQDSFPSLLFLAYKYADSPEEALVANTNVGGENCHRGAALGLLMGAAHGMAAWPQRWREGLQAREEIEREATRFGEACKGAYEAAAGGGGKE